MSGTLPTWMEKWFGLSHGAGMGVAWRLDYHWPWPAWATLLVFAAVVAAIVGVYLRESPRVSRGYRLALAAIRLLAVGLVFLMIAQLALFLQRTGLPFVVVIIDDTQSMNTVDSYDEGTRKSLEDRVARTLVAKKLSRWNIARSLLAEEDGQLLASLAESHKLRFYYLSDMKESQPTETPGILAELKKAEANGDRTRLGSAVRSALDELRGTTPVAILLVTDGVNTEGPGLPDAADYARRKGVPLLFVGVGSDRPARELKLSDLEVEDRVFVGDLVHFRFQLTAQGFAGKRVSVVLRREKQPGSNSQDKGEEVGRIEVTIPADARPQEVVLPYRPAETGQFRYTIDVEPDVRSTAISRNSEEPAKAGTTNDLPAHQPLVRSIHVLEEKIRVLLVEGGPRFEYRFLRNLLSRDKTIKLSTLLQGGDIEFRPIFSQYEAGGGETLTVFPVSREELSKFDVVIFGDVNPSLLSPAALENLADFVDHPDKGGALVLIAGPNFMPLDYRDTPLARLMPFDPAKASNPPVNQPLTEGFVVQPTEMGLTVPSMQLSDSPQESRAIWQKLPPFYWMTEVSDLKPAARVLAEHPTRLGVDGKHLPLIIMQYVGGGGQVLFHAIDETYRWRRGVGDMYFARYWIQTLRFLARSKLAEGDRSARLSTDRRDYPWGEPVRMQVRFNDERLAPLDDGGVTVELEQVGRQTQKVQLHRTETGRGHFEAVLNNLPAGGYHAKIISPPLPGRVATADFVVDPSRAESMNVPVDAAAMRQAAKATNGEYFTLANADTLIDKLPAGRPEPVETLPPVPLWNRWPLLALVLGLLIVEWLLRKRSGMV
jgi:hypothetical protein